jgi:protein-tyrosine phosphatase
MRAAMIDLYRHIPSDHAPSYRVMLDRLATGNAPLLINCAAGKDRTGIGAALILGVLGVSRALIEGDYLLTNTYADWERLFSSDQVVIDSSLRRAPEIMAPLLAADIAYLNAFYDVLERNHGGLDGYIDSLGVDASALERMRGLLLD